MIVACVAFTREQQWHTHASALQWLAVEEWVSIFLSNAETHTKALCYLAWYQQFGISVRLLCRIHSRFSDPIQSAHYVTLHCRWTRRKCSSNETEDGLNLRRTFAAVVVQSAGRFLSGWRLRVHTYSHTFESDTTNCWTQEANFCGKARWWHMQRDRWVFCSCQSKQCPVRAALLINYY